MVSIEALEEAGGTVRSRSERYDIGFENDEELEAVLEEIENDEYDWSVDVDYSHNNVRIRRGTVYQ